MDGIKYNLTEQELRELREACRAMKLPWEAQAARPESARKLIEMYKTMLQMGIPLS